MARTAALLVVGSEILSGKTEDTNSRFLARELRSLGVELKRILVVPDEREAIVAAVRAMAPCHDLVFTSGGVGPTHDDITLEAVAEALGRKLVRNAAIAALIARHHDVARNPLALRMADLPEGAVLVEAADLKVPVVMVENLWILPGVPAIFERKVRAIGPRFRDLPYHLRQVFVGIDEEEMAGALFDLAARYPDVAIGSYPEWGSPSHRVKLTIESKDRARVEAALADLLVALPEGALRRVE